MKNRYILLGIIIIHMTIPSFPQSSGRVYTEEEVRLASTDCDCRELRQKLDASVAGSFSLMITGGFNYLYGSNGDDHSFSSNLIGLDGEVMFGYSYYKITSGEGSSLGVFIRGGILPHPALKNLIEEGEVNVGIAEEDDNVFYNIEGGAIIGGFFRITTGLGFQEYKSEVNELKRISYYSTTPGILLGSETVKLSIYVNVLYGRDIKETLYKPGIGLTLKF